MDDPAVRTNATEHGCEVGVAREPLAFPGGAKRTGPWKARPRENKKRGRRSQGTLGVPWRSQAYGAMEGPSA
jgi:hypothetical protein